MTDPIEAKYLISINQIQGMEQEGLKDLVEYFGSAEAAWKSQQHWRKALSMSSGRLESVLDAKKGVDPDKFWDYAQKIGVKITSVNDDEYPEAFRHIHETPYFIYYFGTLPPPDRLAFTVVGSRKCSDYGRNLAKKITDGLVRIGKAVIVAGMAEGIDAAAHWAALNAGGDTVAVLGCGIDVIYPMINAKLYARLKDDGCILTEYPFGADPLRHHFPKRNRLMSALGRGVIVVEARPHSGVIHTVNHGLEQGKDVFAVPGDVNHSGSKIPNMLIREGSAKLIENAIHVLEEYLSDKEIESAQCGDDSVDFSKYPSAQRSILEAMREGPVPFDMLQKISGLAPSELSALLTQWEMDEVISQHPGRQFALCGSARGEL